MTASGGKEGEVMKLVTIVGSERLSAGDVSAARDAAAAVGMDAGAACWTEAEAVAEFSGTGPAAAVRDAVEAAVPHADVIVQAAAERRRRLFIADMDSTMITVECIDELADYAGLKAEISAVTEAAMRGEIDFIGALEGRVALLAQLPVAAIDDCLRDRVRLSPGAQTLVRTLRLHGVYTLLVSGGFTRFTGPVAEMIGFDEARANVLETHGDVLTGKVVPPIVDANAKREALTSAAQERGIALAETIAIGDGANDLLMVETAGLGVAYHAKPKLADAADMRIRRGDLTVLLHALGIPRADWISA
jgi:phosphoserine phosphatase